MFDNTALLRLAAQVKSQATKTPFPFVSDVSHFVEHEELVPVDFSKKTRWFDNEQDAWMQVKVGVDANPKIDIVGFEHLFTLPSGTAAYAKLTQGGHHYALAATWLNDDDTRAVKIMVIDRRVEPDSQYLGLIMLVNEWADGNVDFYPYEIPN